MHQNYTSITENLGDSKRGGGSSHINPMLRLGVVEQSRYIVNNASHPQYLSRYHGGHRRDNHPYISGYWYFVINPPYRLFGDEGSKTLSKARDWMFCTAEAFTPPSRTLTKVDVPGMGGMASSYVAGQDITRTFTVTFREYQELPIFNILQTWTSVLDPNTGVSPLAGDEFISSNYKGSAFVALCKPTIGRRESSNSNQSTQSFSNNGTNTGNSTGGSTTDLTHLSEEDIEQIFYFDGVFPEGAPYDSLNSDISTNEGLSISVNFSFDGFPLLKDSAGVLDEFLGLVGSASNLRISSTYEHYRDNVNRATAVDSRSNSGNSVGTGDMLNGSLIERSPT